MKAALITGGGSGIGEACAAEFLRRGRPVVIVGRTQARLDAAVDSLGALERVLALRGDVADEAFAVRAFAAARERFGAVEVLVNNAAVLHMKPFMETSPDEWDETMRANLRGPFLFCREFLRAPGRVIVNIGSLAGVHGTVKFPGLSAYTVSKYGITGLTAALAADPAAAAVGVYCVAPGAVDTEMLRKAAPGLKAGAVPADIARVVVELAEAPFPTLKSGETLALDTNR